WGGWKRLRTRHWRSTSCSEMHIYTRRKCVVALDISSPGRLRRARKDIDRLAESHADSASDVHNAGHQQSIVIQDDIARRFLSVMQHDRRAQPHELDSVVCELKRLDKPGCESRCDEIPDLTVESALVRTNRQHLLNERVRYLSLKVQAWKNV